MKCMETLWENNSSDLYLLSSSSNHSYPQAAAVSKFLSSHSSVAGSFTSDSAALWTPYLSPNKQMKNGAHRPILSKHKRRTCSLFCWDWLLFQRKSTGINDVPRSLHILFSWGNIFSCKKSRSAWKSLKVEHTKGRMTWRRAVSLLAVHKLEPSRSFGIDHEKIRANQKNLTVSFSLNENYWQDVHKMTLWRDNYCPLNSRSLFEETQQTPRATRILPSTHWILGNVQQIRPGTGRDGSCTSHQSSRNFWINVA